MNTPNIDALYVHRLRPRTHSSPMAGVAGGGEP